MTADTRNVTLVAAGGERGTAPRRLLVISYHYPPARAVGGLRWGGITKYLARKGWEIDVVAHAVKDGGPAVKGVHVHPVRRARTLNDVYRSLRPKAPGGVANAVQEPGGGEARADRGVGERFVRAIGSAMAYPSHARGWLHRAAYTARRILRSERIEHLVTSGPPHIAHTVGLIATLGLDVDWTVDLRDPWSGSVQPDTPLFLNRITEQMERATFRRCDRIVCNTRQFAESLQRRLPERDVHWIPNGVDLEDLPEREASADGPVTITYAGTLYLRRDFAPVLQAMARFGNRSTHLSEPAVRLRFAGYADAPHLARLLSQARDLALDEDQVEVLGGVPRSEARAIAQRGHLALVLAQGQPFQVPAKLYELVGMGIPTLVLAESGSASATEAERLGALSCTPDDVDAITAVIERVAGGELPEPLPPTSPFDYEHVAAKVAAILTDRRAGVA